MRPSQKQNRARGRGNRKPNGNVVNRVFESAGPEGKVRGTPQQIIDKYLTLARDSQTSGDRVMSENFLQHAEHYQRILLDAQGVRQEPRKDQSYGDQAYGDQDGSDGDGGDDSGRDDSGRDDSGRDDSGRDDSGSDDTEREQASDRASDRESRQDQREDRGKRPRAEGRGQNRRNRASSENRESDVSGLTTIDSGPEDGDNLLVEAEDLSASQPPRRRRNQRRDKNQDSPEAESAESQRD